VGEYYETHSIWLDLATSGGERRSDSAFEVRTIFLSGCLGVLEILYCLIRLRCLDIATKRRAHFTQEVSKPRIKEVGELGIWDRKVVGRVRRNNID